MSGNHLIMRFLAMALLTLPCTAFCVAVPTLPAPEFADTEASTNLPFAVSFDAMSRIEFSLSLVASSTNNVEVSIGNDADGDGNLSVWETAHTFGFDCGRWFVRDAARDEVKVIGKGEQWNLRIEKTFLLKKSKLDEAWNLVKVTRRGRGDIGEVVMVEGRKPGYVLEVR